MAYKTIELTLPAVPGKNYSLLIGEGLLDQAGELLRPHLPEGKTFIVTDENVASLYLTPLEARLTNAGVTVRHIILPAGEMQKNLFNVAKICETALAGGADRQTVFIALGGGVIGDMTGFAAAMFKRGVPFIQIPTTLLAQVDSSVGGKTAVNLGPAKNMVGAFHQPALVLADTGTLKSLPERQIFSGFAEIFKIALATDAAFFAQLERNVAALPSKNPDILAETIEISCRLKAEIVMGDEKETGRRALLNLGHTFAHAFEEEAIGRGDDLLHGEAVALGCRLACRLSTLLGHMPVDESERVEDFLRAVNFPLPKISYPPMRLLEHMRHDKKAKNERLTFILCSAIGETFIKENVQEEAVLEILKML